MRNYFISDLNFIVSLDLLHATAEFKLFTKICKEEFVEKCDDNSEII